MDLKEFTREVAVTLPNDMSLRTHSEVINVAASRISQMMADCQLYNLNLDKEFLSTSMGIIMRHLVEISRLTGVDLEDAMSQEIASSIPRQPREGREL